ncbi:hypothetical protein AAF712_012001 [Marasmius tenuissimus]|uniref:Uncharacterized protein n=1 Tax=Marasmius tenuissimus TaxID=585030 RepID=A0ABR2ZHX8_9AGAR
MPRRAVIPFRQKGTKPYSKSQRYTLVAKRLRNILGQLRIVAGIKFPSVPIHFKNQDAAPQYFVGTGTEVAGPSHPNFRDLGRIYYAEDGETRYPLQDDIPLSLLTSSRELLACLKERAQLKKWDTLDLENPDDEEPINDTLISASDEEEAEAEEEIEVEDELFEVREEFEEELFEVREEIEEDDEIVITGCRFPYEVKVWIYVSDEECCSMFYVKVYPRNGYKLTLNSMKAQLIRLGIRDGAAIERKHGDDWFFQPWDVPFVAPPQGKEIDLSCLAIPGWSEEWTEDMNP